jgi:hypothetical protein
MSLLRLAVAIPALFACALAPAAESEFAGVPDRVQVLLGGTAADFVTEGGLSLVDAGTGIAVNFEDMFDIPVNKSASRIDGFWRFGKRSYLDFGYVQYNRTGGRELVQEVDWGEYTFEAGAFVTADWDSRFPYAAYRYGFLDEDRVRISGSAGISYLGVDAALEAEAGVTGPQGPVSGAITEGVSIDFPVPLVGLRLDWALRDRLAVEMFMRFFKLNYESVIDGGMRESAARLKWHFSKPVGLAIGYDATSVRLKEYETGDYKAKFTYDITGLSAYLTLAF